MTPRSDRAPHRPARRRRRARKRPPPRHDAKATAADRPPPAEREAPARAGTIRLWLNGKPTRLSDGRVRRRRVQQDPPDVKVVLERQQWTGIVERQTTALSGNGAPDVVEFGNTQAQAFEAAGALVDLTDELPSSAATTSCQSLLEAGTYDGKLYAVPYYAGARIMIYRTDLFEESGIEIPTTLDEMVAAGEQLKADNADVAELLGDLPAGQQLARGDVVRLGARRRHRHQGRRRVGRAPRLARIGRRARVLQGRLRRANAAPADADDANDWLAFCAGEVGMMPAPGWKPGQIIDPDEAPGDGGEHRRLRHARQAAGTTAPVFLGGSNIGIPANSETRSSPTTCSRSWSRAASSSSSPRPGRSRRSSPS